MNERAELLRGEDEEPAGDPDFQAIESAVMETARGRWFLAEYAKRHRSADTGTILDALHRIEASIARPAAAMPDAARRMGPPLADALAELRFILGGARPGESAPDRLVRAQAQLNMLEHRLHSFAREIGYDLPAGRPLSKQPTAVQGNLPTNSGAPANAPPTGGPSGGEQPSGAARLQPPSIPAPARSSYWSSDRPLTPAMPNLPPRSVDQARPRPEPVERSAFVAAAAPMPQAGDLRLSAPTLASSPAFQEAPSVTAGSIPGAQIAEPLAVTPSPPSAPAMTERPRPPDPTLRMTAGEKAALFS
jgi:hypothetical protein